MVRHRITDEQWECLAGVFPPPKGTGRPRANLRNIVDAVVWILCTGSQWRDLPKSEFGSWETVYCWFNRWTSDGTLDEILHRLKAAMAETESFDHELWCIDGSVIRAHRCAGGGGIKSDPCEPDDHALGRSRGGFSTKIHLLCDGAGHPLHVALTAGQAHETTALEEVLECVDVPGTDDAWEARPVRLAGDKAYDAEWIRDYLAAEEIAAVIPRRGRESQAPSEFDRKRYRGRNVIERLVGRLKECRRIFSRFEKTAVNYLGMLKLAMIRFYLKLFCPPAFSNEA